ncbi:hypothetical protein DIPPA_10236 [Diplonema papillatum]|nr:hypothetical protein DIPPA_10236 [Diplonema papillatum]
MVHQEYYEQGRRQCDGLRPRGTLALAEYYPWPLEKKQKKSGIRSLAKWLKRAASGKKANGKKKDEEGNRRSPAAHPKSEPQVSRPPSAYRNSARALPSTTSCTTSTGDHGFHQPSPQHSSLSTTDSFSSIGSCIESTRSYPAFDPR